MARVSIETTIPSFYYETRTDRRSQDWREQTRLWWDRYRVEYELVTSDFVIAEFLRASQAKSVQADNFFQSIEVLPVLPRLEEVISFYMEQKLMPDDAAEDAAHLAMASLHAVEFILTWNCRHLANANKAPHIRILNARLGLQTPIIATPFEVVPE
jgi:hypothetical protein